MSTTTSGTNGGDSRAPSLHAKLGTLRRLVRHYGSSVYHGARGDPARILPTAYRAMRARLKYGIGPIPFSILQLAQVPESQWSTYVFDSESFKRMLRERSPREMLRIAYNKVLFYEHCLQARLPTIPVVCRVGETPDPLGPAVVHAENAVRFAALLESAPARLFIKPIDGTHAESAFLATRVGDGFEFAARRGSAQDLFSHLEDLLEFHTGFIVQPQIRPHADMRCLASENGLPTVRVITAMYEAGPRVLFACLKIPVGTSISDNFADGAGGNLLAGIDLENGTLTPARGSLRRDWPVIAEFESHPDTGYRIAGSRLPFWNEIAQAARNAQASLPKFRTVGWDVAATADGVLLVEANASYDMSILQVAHQRGLKAELTAKLDGLDSPFTPAAPPAADG